LAASYNDEDDALRYFLANVDALRRPVDRIVIRPHPSEARDKYAWAEQAVNLLVVRGGQRGLVAEIAEADVVVGCESMALVVALAAGKQAVSCIPPGGKACALPHSEIAHLSMLAPPIRPPNRSVE
jgi:hypothetical protein